MNGIDLSVLLCCVPGRSVRSTPLLDKLSAQSERLPVEVLALYDNHWRPTGAKRNTLLELAQGEYFSFVDDDDTVVDDYCKTLVEAIRAHEGVDLIVFGMSMINDGRIIQGPRWPDLKANSVPLHTMCIRKAIAPRFAECNMGEDQTWSQQLRGKATTQVKISRELYTYDAHREFSRSAESNLRCKRVAPA